MHRTADRFLKARRRILRPGLGRSAHLLKLEDRTAPALLTVTSNADSGSGSLRAILAIADGNGEHDTISFAPGVTTINLTSGELKLTGENKNLTIDGPGVTINAAPAASATNRIFNFNVSGGNPTITLKGLTLANGNLTSGNNGGAILFHNDPLVLDGVTFLNNKTASSGGAIASTSAIAAILTVNNSTFKGNSASTGGAINGTGSITLNISNTTFDSNTSSSNGAGIHLAAGTNTVTINKSVFSDNIASGNGGAISNGATTTFTITRSVFTGNQGPAGGAFRFAGTPTVTIDETTVSGNLSKSGVGGGIYFVSGGSLILTNSTVSGNTATTAGGGLSLASNSTTITNSTISGNTANSATLGGGGITVSTGPLTINNSTLTGNSAPGTTASGGGIRKTSTTGAVTLSSTILAGNSAATGGADFHLSVAGTVNILGGDNLVGVADVGGFTLSGTNLTGTAASPLNPLLGPLQNNGGPTFTHALKAGSPAFNAGNNNLSLSFDQRGGGFPRVIGGITDAGAFEGVTVIPSASASLANVPPVNPTYVAQVIYNDETGINTATIDVNDVRLTGPGYGVPAVPVSASFVGSGTSVTATYTFTPPGGSWDAADNGTYTLVMQANQVFDTDGTPNPVMAGPIGSFTVAVGDVITVTTELDVVDPGDGLISLREAIEQANDSIISFDTITFAPSLIGKTINLTGGELKILGRTFISGPGQDSLTISGNNSSRVFNIDLAGSGSPVGISGLTLTGGKVTGTGGAINFTDDELTLTDVAVVGNTAGTTGGGINWTTGILLLRDSLIGNNSGGSTGGGLRMTTGILDVDSTRITGNTTNTGAGGGVYLTSGKLFLRNSTVDNNKSGGTGGGGISASTGKLAIVNTTISSNLASGAGVGGGVRLSGAADFKVFNSTFTKNVAEGAGGGGVSFASAGTFIEIHGTIIAGNENFSAPDVYGSVANINFIALDSIVGAFEFGGNLNVPFGSFQSGTIPDPLDAKLTALGFFGGPTPTHGLKSGSPALNSGSNVLGLDFDQRGEGFPRVLNGQPDVGAFEGINKIPSAGLTVGEVNTANVNPLFFTVTYDDDVGINLATLGGKDGKPDILVSGAPGFVTPAEAVYVSDGGPGKTVTVTYKIAPPGGSWGVEDNGTYTLTLQPGAVFDLDVPPIAVPEQVLGTFRVAVPLTFVVDTELDAVDATDGKLSLREAILEANAKNLGVADVITFAPALAGKTIALTGGELVIADPVFIKGPGAGDLTISGNNAGRIFNINVSGALGPTSTIRGVTLTGGSTTTSGGAITMTDDRLTLEGVLISGNKTTGTAAHGVAVHLTTGEVIVNDSTIDNNIAGGRAAINASSGSITLNRSTISGTTAGATGGALYITTGRILVNESTINNNSAATVGGGGIRATTGTVILINSTLSSNVALGTGVGGGVHVSGSGTLKVYNSTVTQNEAKGSGGGGISIGSATAKVLVSSSVVAQNSNASHPDIFTSVTTSLTVDGSGNVFGILSDGDIIYAGANLSGSLAAPLNAKLAPLAVAGGPTRTHVLSAGSPALGFGENLLGLTTDQRGLPRTTGGLVDAGAAQGVATSPFAFIDLSEPVEPGATSYGVRVTYTDDVGIQTASLKTGNIQVTGPAGFDATPTFVGFTGTGSVITATYQFTPPGGSWEAIDNGFYTFTMVKNQVTDGSEFVPAGTLGTLKVSLGGLFVVDTELDVVDAGDAKTSLREALDGSNFSAAVTDTITFAPGLSGKTIVLTKELSITDGVILKGPGAGLLTISGNNVGRVLNIDIAGAGAATTISGLTITGGNVVGTGAGINMTDDVLTLTKVVVTGNKASTTGGGINLTTGVLNLIDSTVSNNSGTTGAGVRFTTGSVNVSRSTISGNTGTGLGAGFYLTSGTLTIEDSTIDTNTTSSTSGGAGIQVSTGTVTLVNSTVSSNTAPSGPAGGIRVSSTGTLSVFNSTITKNVATATNGAGGLTFLSATAKVTLESSIVAQNVNPVNPDVFSTVTANLTVNGSNNLIGAASDFDIIFTGTNLAGTVGAEIDAKLGPLANNGGTTRTHLPQANSPAINQGSNQKGLTLDQRGAARVSGIAPDIGSVELDPNVPVAVAVLANITSPGATSYSFDVTYSDDAGIKVSTLKTGNVRVTGPNAFDQLAAFVGVDVGTNGTPRVATYKVTPSGGVFDKTNAGLYTVVMEADQVADTDDGLFVAAGPLGTFRAAFPGQFIVTTELDVVDPLDGLTSLREALVQANDNIDAVDTITFDPSLNGKTILLSKGELPISDGVLITGPGMDKLTISGGNVSRVFNINDGTINSIPVTISGLTLTQGNVTGDGGAIYVQNENLTLIDVRVSKSVASVDGGGINFETGGSLNLIDSEIVDNRTTSTAGDGGGINFETAATVLIERSLISGNTSGDDGGGLYFNGGGNLIVRDSAFVGNSGLGTVGGAGAINFLSKSPSDSYEMINTTVSGNFSADDAGALQFQAWNGTAFIRNSTVVFNNAPNSSGTTGGVSQFSGGGTIVLESTVVSNNNNPIAPDLFTTGTIAAKNSVIGTKTGISGTFQDDGNNQFGVDILVTTLGNFGGPTPAHLPLPGSPLLNAGLNTQGLAFDQRGPGFPRVIGGQADVGAIEADPSTPLAVATLTDVTVEGGTSYSFQVTYYDDVGINVSTLKTGNVTLTGPGGFAVTPAFVSVDNPANGTPRTATYQFTPPGGDWDNGDNGTYVLTMQPNQVGDTNNGLFVPGGVLDTFRVLLPGTIIVDTELDVVNPSDGKTSLREAVADSNLTFGQLDRILFAPNLIGKTINLTGGELLITDSVEIVGPGAGKLTLSGGNLSRIFKVENTSAVLDVLISGLALTNGFAGAALDGGAVFNNGETVTFDGVLLRNNQARYGGAVAVTNAGRVNFFNSSLVFNKALSGDTTQGAGAVDIRGVSPYLYAVNSTFSNNEALAGVGGAIATYSTTSAKIELVNSTVTENFAKSGGGGIRTFSATGSSVLLNSSIVAGNFSVSNAQQDIQAGSTPVTATDSIVGVSDSGITSFTKNGGFAGTLSSPFDAKLGPLQDNGGPTPTHLPLAGSPAIDAGNNPLGLTTDQRGGTFVRVFGDKADIGAVEVQPVSVKPITATVKIDDGSAQRSVVRSFTVTFSETPSFPSGIAAAFQLVRTGPASGFASTLPTGSVNIVATPVGTVVTLTFTDPTFTEGKGSLIDGNYTLTLVAANIVGAGGKLDGNGDGTGGDNQVVNTFRLFGDGNGDRNTNFTDFLQFRSAFGATGPGAPYNPAFDFDGNNTIDFSDFLQFRSRFGATLGTP